MSLPPPVPLTIVPCGEPREPALLETTLSRLSEHCTVAPQWRIARWSFAAAADGRTFVRGLPLPALPGTQWVETDGICVPAGTAWSPAVEPAVLRQLLRLAPGDIALLRSDGTWDRLAAGDWVRASRSAVSGSMPGKEPERR